MQANCIGPNAGGDPKSGVRIIRHEDARKKLKVSAATLFGMCAKGQFPKPFVIVPGGRAVGWLEHEVDDWIISRQAAGFDKTQTARGEGK
jgi:prophage regulatory protein